MSGQLLEHEIFEQPDVVKQLINLESSGIDAIVSKLRGSFDFIMMAARGTSDNAARYAKYLFGERNDIPVALAAPSLFTIYKNPPKMGRALVLGISQSGQSPDIISVLKEARKQGKPTLAITNDSESPLAETADYTINLRAGREQATAATKTYTSTLVALAMMSTFLNEDQLAYKEIKLIPTWIEETLRNNEALISQAGFYSEMSQCSVISRGYDYATAFEISLKLKELTHTIAEPYSSADFLHGPIAILQTGSFIIMVASSGKMLDDMLSITSKIIDIGAKIIMISNNSEMLNLGDYQLPVCSNVPDWLFPVVSVLPGQLMSLGLAKAKQLDPDQPKGITKVTRTW